MSTDLDQVTLRLRNYIEWADEIAARNPRTIAGHWANTYATDMRRILDMLLSLAYDDRPTRSEQSLEGAAVNGLTPVGQEAELG